MPSTTTNKLSEYLIIILLGAILFIPFLGGAHLFDWDEANFGEAAREMIITNNWLNPQIDYQLFWEKPPIFIWMQAVSMKLFGISEFASRFPNAVIGIATLCILFYLGQKVVNKRMAWLWVFLYMGTWLTHFYFKSAIIDPTFNLFIFLSIYGLYQCIQTKKWTYALWTGIAIGLGVLTKGPVAALMLGLTGMIYIIYKRRFFIISGLQYLLILLSCVLTIGLWLGMDIYKNGLWFTETFLTYQYRLFSTQDAGHGGPWFYHPIVLLIGCFPASILFLNVITRREYWIKKSEQEQTFHVLMSILFFAHLILFSIVKTKIIHYSSLCYFPLTFWAAVELEKLIQSERPLKKWVHIVGLIIGGIIGLAIMLLPLVGQYKSLLAQYIKDKFTLGNLEADVPFSTLEMSVGFIIIVNVVLLMSALKCKNISRMYLHMLINAILITSTIAHFTPKIEAFSQGGAIGFYQKAKEDNKYVYTLMMKSYAYLFYSEKMPPTSSLIPQNAQEALNVNNPYRDDFYFVSKNIHKERILNENPALESIDERAGYVLYRFKKSN